MSEAVPALFTVDTPLPPLPARGARAKVAPITIAQWPYWYRAQIDPHSRRDYLRVDVALDGVLDTTALRRAAQLLVVRQATLRTLFRATSADVTEQVVDDADRQFVLDLVAPHATGSVNSWTSGQQQLDQLDAHASLNLAEGPVARFMLLRLDDRRSVLRLLVHHIAMDGWSVAIYVRDLLDLYRRVRKGQRPPPPLAIEYTDYASWSNRLRATSRFEQLTSYWRRAFATLPVRSALGNQQGPISPLDAIDVRIDAGTMAALTATAAAERWTPFSLLLTALQLPLHYWTGARDLVVGVAHANRTNARTFDVIGLFADTLPVRLETDGAVALRQLVRQTTAAIAEALTHGMLSFHEIRKLLPAASAARERSVLQVLVNIDDRAPSDRTLDDLAMRYQERPTLPNLDLPHELIVSGARCADGSLRLAIRGNPHVFNATTLGEFARLYVASIRAMSSDRTVAALPVHAVWTRIMDRSSNSPPLPIS